MESTQTSRSAGASEGDGVSPWRGWLIFAAPTFLFFLVQALRNDLSSNVQVVETIFNLTATTFAVASGVYFFVYAPCQLASGLFVDWIGSRYILAASGIVCAAATLLLAIGSSNVALGVSRGLAGLGSGVPLLVAIYLASIWLPEDRLPIATGLSNGLGALGSFLAIWLLPLMIAASSWSTVMYGFGVVWLVASGMVLVVVPRRPKWAIPGHTRSDVRPVFRGVKYVLSKGRFWLLTTIGTLIVAPLSVLGGLWGSRYLTEVRDWGTADASFAAGAVFLGFTVGSIFSGFVGESRVRGRSMSIGSGILILTMTLLLLGLDSYPVPIGMAFMFLIGVGTGGVSLMYALVARISGPEHRATGTALILFPGMVFSGVVQAVSGWLIDDAVSSGETVETAFNRALGFPAVLAGIATILAIIGVIHAVVHQTDQKEAS